jgi:hypothetical protein
MSSEVNDQVISVASELGEALMPVKEAAFILEVDEGVLGDLQHPIGHAYTVALKQTLFKYQKIVVSQALAGSKPAQDMVKAFIDKLNMDAEA